MIKIKKLTKKYRGKIVLNRVSFDMEYHSCLGLLGHNGAGKTTLLGIISGLINPCSGSVEIFGLDIKKDAEKVRPLLGIWIQDSSFDKDLTVEDALFRMCMLKGLKSKAAFGETKRLVREFRLGDFAGKKVKELSHGMFKALGVAQAFIGSPKVILLDEPLAGLDTKRKSIIRGVIKKEMPKTTMIISSHLLDEVELLCSDFMILDKGRIKIKEKVSRLKYAEPHFAYNMFPIKKEVQGRLKRFRSIKNIEKSSEELIIHSKKDVYNKLKSVAKKYNCRVTGMKSGKSIEDIFFESTN